MSNEKSDEINQQQHQTTTKSEIFVQPQDDRNAAKDDDDDDDDDDNNNSNTPNTEDVEKEEFSLYDQWEWSQEDSFWAATSFRPTLFIIVSLAVSLLGFLYLLIDYHSPSQSSPSLCRYQPEICGHVCRCVERRCSHYCDFGLFGSTRALKCSRDIECRPQIDMDEESINVSSVKDSLALLNC